MSEYLRFDDIARELGIPVRTVYHLNQSGQGPKCLKVGRSFLVSREDYKEWLEARKQG
jgi:excisionase family DNA binding protein